MASDAPSVEELSKKEKEKYEKLIQQHGIEGATFWRVRKKREGGKGYAIAGEIPGYEDNDEIRQALREKYGPGMYRCERFYTDGKKTDQGFINIEIVEFEGANNSKDGEKPYFERDPRTGELITPKLLQMDEEKLALHRRKDLLKAQRELERLESGEYDDDDDDDISPEMLHTMMANERAAATMEAKIAALESQLNHANERYEEERRRSELQGLQTQINTLADTMKKFVETGGGGGHMTEIYKIREESQRQLTELKAMHEKERQEFERRTYEEKIQAQKEAFEREMQSLREKMSEKKGISAKDIQGFAPLIIQAIEMFKGGQLTMKDLMGTFAQLQGGIAQTQSEAQKYLMENVIGTTQMLVQQYLESQNAGDDPMSMFTKIAGLLGQAMSKPGSAGAGAPGVPGGPPGGQLPPHVAQQIAMQQAQAQAQAKGRGAQPMAAGPKSPFNAFIRTIIEGITKQDDDFDFYVKYAMRVLPDIVLNRIATAKNGDALIGLIAGYTHVDTRIFKTPFGKLWLDGFLEEFQDYFEDEDEGADYEDQGEGDEGMYPIGPEFGAITAGSGPAPTEQSSTGSTNDMAPLPSMAELFAGGASGFDPSAILGNIDPAQINAILEAQGLKVIRTSEEPQQETKPANGKQKVEPGTPVPTDAPGNFSVDIGPPFDDVDVEIPDEETLAKRQAEQEAIQTELEAKEWLLKQDIPKWMHNALIYTHSFEKAKAYKSVKGKENRIKDLDKWIATAYEAIQEKAEV